MRKGHCVFCGGELELPQFGQPGRSEECPHCQRDIHSCRQCRFFDPKVRNECREPRAELQRDKAAAKFCEWFEFQGGAGQVGEEHTAAEDAKKKLKDLFKS